METEDKTKTRSTIKAFCKLHNIKKIDFASSMGVSKQHVTNWELADYVVEHDPETGQVDIIKAEKVVKSCTIATTGGDE